MKIEQHVTLVAALNIGFGVLGVLIGIIVFTAITGGGILSGDSEAIAITSVVGTAVGGFIVILSIPEIIAGIWLLKRRPWARILAIIIACLDVIEIPIGTAIGIYSHWVLLNEEATELFKQNSIPKANKTKP